MLESIYAKRALALINHESARGAFPPGGTATRKGGSGFSWWVQILAIH